MTELERRTTLVTPPRADPTRDAQHEATAAPPRTPSFTSRIARRFLETAWLHLLLLTLIGVFLFPFAYMLATSLKTDEELAQTAWLPKVPRFADQSPRVRKATALVRPPEATQARWDEALPQLTSMTRAAVESAPLPRGGDVVDAEHYRATATQHLLTRLVPRLNLDLWEGDIAALVDAYKIALTSALVADALDDRLARL